MGLEVHAELATQSKVFCGCATAFGAPPNSHVCPVCLGLPGSLPVLNRTAVEYALKAAVALNCEIISPSVFERKNYYYPDLPKNYQISQKRHPLARNGHLVISVNGRNKRVGIWDVHLEEDAGKLIHPEDPLAADETLVDYNRSGQPLLEIVSAPDLRSVEEVSAYMETLRSIVLYLGISSARMEEGAIRFEANVSVRPVNSNEDATRVEIKNLNSFKAVTRSLEYEIQRQRAARLRGETILQETRLWDDVRGVTEPMRSKEESHDYRYFPDPDLTPLVIDPDWVERTRANLPELPAARRRRFVTEHGLPEYDARLLTDSREMADFFEAVAERYPQPKAISNWLMGEAFRLLNEQGTTLAESGLTPERLVELLEMIDQGAVNTNSAKQVFEEVFRTGRAPAEIVAERGLGLIADDTALGEIVDRVLAENPKVVAEYRQGKEKSFTFLVGQVMRQTQGRADPPTVNRLLRERVGPPPNAKKK